MTRSVAARPLTVLCRFAGSLFGGCSSTPDGDPSGGSRVTEPAGGPSDGAADPASSGDDVDVGLEVDPTGRAQEAADDELPLSGADVGEADPVQAAGAELGADAVEALRAHLARPRDGRPPLSEQAFARQPLGAGAAVEAAALLWGDHREQIRQTRADEHEARAITVGSETLAYDYVRFGEAPEAGPSLYISLHGGGEAEASVNDQQWENQKVLYQPEEGIYLAPRAPTNTWNLWHQAHVDVLLDRLIENFVALEGVDPNRVYVMGYSAGGDGVYQLAPRMADRWAAAAMMAGHPNDARPESLRNLPFTIHVGGLDTAFDRNLVAAEWGRELDELAAADPGGYVHEVQVHPDKPHWMDLEDAVAVPWMAQFSRNPLPERIVWRQDDVSHPRFYWLAVDSERAAAGARIEATLRGSELELEAEGVQRVRVRLSDALVDLDQPLSVSVGGDAIFSGAVTRNVATLASTLAERGDPSSVFSAEIELDLP